MTHPNLQTNGASLEDCHTNFFALTELSGIKWRKLVWSDSNANGDPLEDPILRGYARCLAADILCVWRRVATPQQSISMYEIPPPAPPPPLSLAAAKELWIFWYGEEPDLMDLVSPELLKQECDQGSQGSWESGLSYECRSLLFKALHNLIERCLLSRDFVRLGKWFVQPCGDTAEGHLSFSFAFFVHGESSVCASIDVRQHPPVRKIQRHHLQRAQASNQGIQVILAPFGLAGTLTGHSYKSTSSTGPDQGGRLLDEWAQFYPIDRSIAAMTGSTAASTPAPSPGDPSGAAPNMDAGGASAGCFGNVVEVIVGGVRMRYPACYVLITDMDQADASGVTHPNATSSSSANSKSAGSLQIPTPPPSPPSRTTSGSRMAAVPIDARLSHPGPFAVSTVANAASMQRAPTAATVMPERAWQECMQTPGACGGGKDEPEWEYCDPLRKVACTCSKCRKRSSGGPGEHRTSSLSKGGVANVAPFHSRPQVVRCPASGSYTPTGAGGGAPRTQESLVIPSVGSPPGSVGASSPLPNPRSAQPPSVPPIKEETMPTLSPHEAPIHDKPAGGDANEGGDAGEQTPKTPLPPRTPKTPKTPMRSESKEVVVKALKRPILLPREDAPEEEDPNLNLLYDYSTMTAWINHPVKRYRGQEDAVDSGKWQNVKNADLYEMYSQEIKVEPRDEPASPGGGGKPSQGGVGKRPGDPYEFDEDLEKKSTIKEESAGAVKTTQDSLFTSEGLQPSYKDLEEIFDHPDEASPEVLQMATPPGSNKPSLPTGEEKKFFTTMLTPAELSKMFPTPPSLERPIASPQLEISMDLGGGLGIGPQIYPAMGSPREEHIEDWSYVFRPPATSKMLGSSKYAPLNNLPSQNLPPVQLPTNCSYKPSWVSRELQQREALLSTPATTNSNAEEKRPGPVSLGGVGADLFIKNKDFFAEKPSPATSTATNSMEEAITPNPSASAVAPNPVLGRIEVNSLLVNILLADTLLNIFRDHNFDSCTLCVCNAGPKVVGNIKGADALIYLPSASGNANAGNFLDASGINNDDDQIRCSCGFSAIINRRLAHKSGLFYEDEMEITGIAQDPALNAGASLVSSNENSILELIREQCVVIQNSASAIFRLESTREDSAASVSGELNILEYSDGNDITTIVLDHYGELRENIRTMCDFRGDFARRSREARDGKSSIHRWPYLRARGPQCNQDIVRVMRALQPLLQSAIQKKCQTRLWEPPSAVKGPLTWRQFHRLAGRGTDDRCEPQPIPSVIVGHEKEWLSLSPYALQHWEALLLEPYSYSRDIAFVVLCPDNEVIAKRARRFFRELSSSYEMCKLGRHQGISKISREGIVRIKKIITPDTKPSETEEITSYASSCRTSLSFLAQLPMDKTLLDTAPPGKDDLLLEAGAALAVDKPATPLTPKTSEEDLKEQDHSTNSSFASLPLSGSQLSSASTTNLQTDEDEREIPAVVVYIVDPYTDSGTPSANSCLSLLRNFDAVVQNLGEAQRANVTVQIISQESVIELGRARARRKRHADHMRSLALSVFSQVRRRLTHANSAGKTLTGFGTAAAAELFLKNKDEKNRAPYKLYTPPYVLGPLKAKVENPESFGQPSDAASILYLSYCLSEDQSYLLAVATDEKGEIFETIAINVNIPNRQRRRRSLSLARRLGLQKLMDFVLGVISQSVKPWRLVVGRLGRIGHGELKGWSFLLSRKNLLAASKQIKEICHQCSLMGQHVPSILSACLVSLEPDSTLRLMPDQFTPDERFSQISVNSHLNTPQDVTCTHILVFPTSATTQSSQTTFQEQNSALDPDDELFTITDLNDDMNENFSEDFNDIFNWTETGGAVTSPTGSPRRDDLMGSPSGLHVNQPSPFPSNSGAQRGEMEEIGTVLQQPLALGYLVSTAPTGKMPRWFWASCPHLEGVCPAFLKNALHLHSPNVQQNSEEFLPQTAITSHALDSQYTTDVLRYVLEGYNALSWLALDDNTRDRLSCLPVHVQVLARLYHTTAAFL